MSTIVCKICGEREATVNRLYQAFEDANFGVRNTPHLLLCAECDAAFMGGRLATLVYSIVKANLTYTNARTSTYAVGYESDLYFLLLSYRLAAHLKLN